MTPLDQLVHDIEEANMKNTTPNEFYTLKVGDRIPKCAEQKIGKYWEPVIDVLVGTKVVKALKGKFRMPVAEVGRPFGIEFVTDTPTPTLPDSENQESKQSFKDYDKEWWFEFQAKQFQDMRELTRKKNNDYTGGSMINNPFANFDEAEEFGVDPLLGLALRMGDKMQRLKCFCKEGLLFESNGDTVEDIFRDLIGYSAIALGIIERGKKTHKYK